VSSQPSTQSNATPRVGVVSVNWNGWQDTIKCYEHIRGSTHGDWAFICVDNASADGSAGKLRDLGPGFHLVESATNLGFAGGCNRGIAEAKALGCDYIYLLNNDAFARADTLAKLVAVSQELNDGAVLGTTVRYDYKNALQFWGSTSSRHIGLPMKYRHSEERFAAAPRLIPSDFIIGASLFASRAIFDKVGDFDERYFLNYEETDWCYRARKAGFPSLVVKDALVLHKGGASIGDGRGPLQTYFIRRNRVLFAEKNLAPHQFLIVFGHQIARSLSLLPRFLLARGPAAVAERFVIRADFLATRDYLLRRFGDCPERIRELAAEFRALGIGAAAARERQRAEAEGRA
jgi:GT2 family glycosyltransferase